MEPALPKVLGGDQFSFSKGDLPTLGRSSADESVWMWTGDRDRFALCVEQPRGSNSGSIGSALPDRIARAVEVIQ